MIFVLLIITAIGVYFGLVRNSQVAVERLCILGRMRELSTDYADWRERVADYESVSYDRMVWQFWKPVGSFYEGAKCVSEKTAASH